MENDRKQMKGYQGDQRDLQHTVSGRGRLDTTEPGRHVDVRDGGEQAIEAPMRHHP